MNKKKILLITTTHLAKNPRLVKEIATLKKQYSVEVLFFQILKEYVKFDEIIINDHPEVKFNKINWLHKYYFSRFYHTFLQKLLILFDSVFGKKIFPEQQFFSGYSPLLHKAKKINFDIIHGHNPGSLPVAYHAAKYKNALAGFDAEDFHRGEYETGHPSLSLITLLENKYLPKIDLLLAASPLIAKAYEKTLDSKEFTIINNAFPSTEFNKQEFKKTTSSLKLVWFSQVIGADRGLEAVLNGIRQVNCGLIELYLYGECDIKLQQKLLSFLKDSPHKIYFEGVVSNSLLNKSLDKYDIGIASEIGHTENRNICLTNKIFAYTQAGLAILASDTPAQENYIKTYPGIGRLYKKNNSEEIKHILENWYHHPELLQQCKANAATFASTEINWETESEKLLFALKKVIQNKNTAKLKIALTVDPEIPVPPLLYGGIERIVNLLVMQYTAQGHEVTLFANSNSKVPCKLIAWKGAESRPLLATLLNASQLLNEHNKHQFDIIHCFSRLAYLSPILPKSLIKIMSYQREPTLSQIRKAGVLAKNKSLYFTGCSNYISKQIAKVHEARTIYNGINLEKYKFNATIKEDAPLMFLGRIEEIKGTHLAIDVAKKANKKLIIAGNIPKEGKIYFEKKIKPLLDDQIYYVGAVNDQEKNELLRNSLALLMPIQWEEPFGIVMIEALACGTPVIAFNRGAVPEVIQNGINGFICDDINTMQLAITEAGKIDRLTVRKTAEENFSAETIANAYLKLYSELLTRK